jgi:thiol:disulfide interchange protein DsbC
MKGTNMDILRKGAIALAALSLAGSAFAQSAPDDVAQIKKLMHGKFDAVKRLPVTGLMIVEADGQVYLSSENGRIVVANGRVYDMWNGLEIKEGKDVDKFANKIDLVKMGLNISDLAPLEVGAGKKTVVMFIDPSCPHCHRMMAQAAKLTNEYRFQFVLLPILGTESIEKSKKAICMADKQAAVKALIDNTLAKAPSPDVGCNLLPLQKALLTARIMGVDSVPFIVAPDGTMQRGAPKDLSNWLSSLDSKADSRVVVDNNTKTRNNNRSNAK